jgi:CBS domain-containing protein
MSKGLLAGDLMKRPVFRLTVETPVREAADFLLRHNISGAPVLDERGRWKGFFSMDDIARAAVARRGSQRRERTLEVREPVPEAGPSNLDELGSLQVEKLMTPELVTVPPGASLGEILRCLILSRVHRVFVLSEAGDALDGIITPTDVIRCLHPGESRRSWLQAVDTFGESPGRGLRLIRSSARR